ncbi:5-(carboxyamino)imidazole ribonucleotide synthase [Brevundimonas naejangsanensis]|uniref:N5-carboxyaminoimidazole ribonucleotide synthase n=1 Tax=Brevundimonas naejangsanensis TaxID=588932 RepID=A0A172Y6J2_9CAUL|nr:5-(carboxyamino)imidazole ribonucleotide synthase [Brevundimonas naejangsanensis]ANF54766.1 5-(carboxyamino)imidazole ribonucleotide synthase [Brevundimonas naejangsanensis]
MPDLPLPPGSTLGILGGGQLGRMLAQAAERLGFDVVILDPQPDCPAARVSRAQITAPYDDPDALQALGRLCDVVTFEFENVPAASVETLAEAGALVAPGPTALAVAQDRVDEKTYLNAVGAPTVDFAAVTTLDDLTAAIDRLGLPALLKTRREGYDGKGQVWIRDASDAQAAFDAIGRRPAVLEAAAVFNRELSVIAARGRDGAVAVYPLGENVHQNGVLKTTTAPAAVDPATQGRAEAIAAAVLDGLDYIGVMGIELFDMGSGELLVNEVAPRVHNTGHWTQDGCVCDQFEQHVRAVVGWPLGPSNAHARIEMTNLLGDEVDQWRTLAAEPNARLHLYGKHDARPGRKMAHVNRIL